MNRIEIVLSGGLVTDVVVDDLDVEVSVKDYDIEGSAEDLFRAEELFEDTDGVYCTRFAVEPILRTKDHEIVKVEEL